VTMNRRNLFKMLPVLPLAMVSDVDAGEDTRISFKLEDYVIVKPESASRCRCCNQYHEYYTHGCVTVAFPKEQWAASGITYPVTKNSVPIALAQDCYLEPHQHNDFRWV